MGTKGGLDQNDLDLGFLYKSKGNKKDTARECLFEAVNLSIQGEAEVHLKQPRRLWRIWVRGSGLLGYLPRTT